MKTKRKRHLVQLCTHARPRSRKGPDGRGRGRSITLFAFSWADLAALFGQQVETVQKAAKAGRFEPTDLHSIARAWWARNRDVLEAEPRPQKRTSIHVN